MIQSDLGSSSLSSAQDIDHLPNFTARESKNFATGFGERKIGENIS